MKTEELLEIGLTEEQANKVLAINGKDIERYKKAAETVKADLTTAQEQLAQRDKDIEELKNLLEMWMVSSSNLPTCRVSTPQRPSSTRSRSPTVTMRTRYTVPLPTRA